MCCTYIAIFKRHTYTHTHICIYICIYNMYIYISRYVCVCILYTLQLKNQTCHLLTLSPFLSLSARLSSDHFQTQMDGFRWRDPLDGPPKIVLGDQPKVASDDVWESFSCISLWFASICKLHWNQRRLFSWTVSHLQAVCRSWWIKQQKNHIEGLVSWKFQPPKMQPLKLEIRFGIMCRQNLSNWCFKIFKGIMCVGDLPGT